MKKKIVLLLMSMFIVSAAEAVYALEISGQEVEVTLTETFVSRYIWRGQDLYSNNDGAHQSSIDITFPKLLSEVDLSLNVWGSFPLNKGHEDAEELDYTITFSRNSLDEQFNISAGYTYFDFPNSSSTADVSEPWLAFSLNKIPLLPIDISFSVFAGYDFAAKSGGPDEGWYYSWGFDTELLLPESPLFQAGQALAIGVVNWGNDGVGDLESSGLYATEISFATSYAFSEFVITPSFNYSIGHEESINSGDNELWGGVEFAYSF